MNGKLIFRIAIGLCLLTGMVLFPAANEWSNTLAADNQGQNQQYKVGVDPDWAKKNVLDRRLKYARISAMFYDTPIRDALMDLANQTGVIIVADLSVQSLVTCELKSVSLGKALDIVLSSGNFMYRNMGEFVLVGSMDPNSPSFLKLSETLIIQLKYIKASDAIKMLYEPLRKYASANDEANVVTITAPKPILDKLAAEVIVMDTAPRQIMLEAKVVVLEVGDLLNMGMQWQWPKIQAGAYGNNEVYKSWPWGVQIGYTPGQEFTLALGMTLNLLEQNNEAMILSNSQVMAQHNREAEIKVTTEEYFELVTSGVYSQAKLETIEVGTVLNITPTITETGFITLNVKAEVSDVVSRGENNLPVVTRRQAMSTIRVQDGGTAVVGGLIDHRTAVTTQRVPGLGSVPLAGNLFKNTLDNETSRQVAIFITPRLVSDKPKKQNFLVRKQIKIPIAGKEFKQSLKQTMKIMDQVDDISESTIESN